MLKIIKKNKLSTIMISIIVIFVAMAIIDYLDLYNFFKNREDKSFEKTGHMVLVISAAIAAMIAWWQLIKLNSTAFADLLTKIETRYGSNEILEAREIIQEIYLESKDAQDTCKLKHISHMQDIIKQIGNDAKQTRKFILLLNFLDFLESIAYYVKVGYVSYDDVLEMFGGNLPYWFDVYERWIHYRREKFKEPKMYYEFETLVKKIRDIKTKPCWFCISKM